MMADKIRLQEPLLPSGPPGTGCPSCGSTNIAHNSWCRIHLLRMSVANRKLIAQMLEDEGWDRDFLKPIHKQAVALVKKQKRDWNARSKWAFGVDRKGASTR